MKKIFILSIILALLVPGLVHAAGGITAQRAAITTNGNVQSFILTLTCTADAADGSFPEYVINPSSLGIGGWYLYSILTNPGTPAPTDNYDIAITDADGCDVAGGALQNRDASTTEKVYLKDVGYPIIDGNWSWTMAGNSVNSAVVVARLTFVLD